LPSFLNQDKFNLTLGQTDFKGTFLNLDARWYLNKCEGDESIEGFYIGPYTKFIKYSLDFDMTYDDGDQFLENSGNASFREFGLGLMLGYQLLLWDRLVVDFLFFGPRTSRYRLKFNFEEELSQEFIDSVTNNINETLDKILMRGGIDPEIEPRVGFAF
jgi:hypothetical protein